VCIAVTALLMSDGLAAGGVALEPRVKTWRERDRTARPMCPARAVAERARPRGAGDR
jgi:hypothetical protein